MESAFDLLREFPPVGKAEWTAQVAKDLKERSLEDLIWHPSPELAFNPFVHSEDQPELPAPLWTAPINWEICETIEVSSAESANIQALEALQMGVESLELVLSEPLTDSSAEVLLRDIHLDYISLHFSGQAVMDNPGAILGMLGRVGSAGLPLRGSLKYDPAAAAGPLRDWRYLADLSAHAHEQFPEFRLLSLSENTALDTVAAQADLIRRAHFYFEKLSEWGLAAEQTAGLIQFNVFIGKNYFLELAKLRSLRLLWYNLLEAWQLPVSESSIAAEFLQEVYTPELYTNMIRATTMAMSAVIGGANRLTVRPYDSVRETQAAYPPAFGRHIARNVQHLLKLESGFGDVADPAAGSYYIEQLTRQLSEKAWMAIASKPAG